MTGKPDITVARDHIIIEHQVVQRPARISPMQWLNFWERLIARENLPRDLAAKQELIDNQVAISK